MDVEKHLSEIIDSVPTYNHTPAAPLTKQQQDSIQLFLQQHSIAIDDNITTDVNFHVGETCFYQITTPNNYFIVYHSVDDRLYLHWLDSVDDIEEGEVPLLNKSTLLSNQHTFKDQVINFFSQHAIEFLVYGKSTFLKSNETSRPRLTVPVDQGEVVDVESPIYQSASPGYAAERVPDSPEYAPTSPEYAPPSPELTTSSDWKSRLQDNSTLSSSKKQLWIQYLETSELASESDKDTIVDFLNNQHSQKTGVLDINLSSDIQDDGSTKNTYVRLDYNKKTIKLISKKNR